MHNYSSDCHLPGVFQGGEGHCRVEGPQVENPDITEPLKTGQVNIGTEIEPKFGNIGTIGMMR